MGTIENKTFLWNSKMKIAVEKVYISIQENYKNFLQNSVIIILKLS